MQRLSLLLPSALCAALAFAQEPQNSSAPTDALLVPMVTDEQLQHTRAKGQGEVVYNKTTQGFYFFNGTVWEPMLMAEPGENGAGINWSLQRTSPIGQGMLKLFTGDTGSWDLGGNAQTDPTINFLGTTDPQPLKFRVYNTPAGQLGINAAENMGFGFQSGVGTGTQNTFFGGRAGQNITSGNFNTFVGQTAGRSITTGSNNTFVGNESGVNTTTATANVFLGSYTGKMNTTGWANTFLGVHCGEVNTTGQWNVIIGTSCGAANTTGANNVFMGVQAANDNTTGSNNVIIGELAAYVADASDNTMLGTSAGMATTSGNSNVFLGRSSGTANTTGSGNVTLGFNSAVNSGALTNATAIGNRSRVDASNCLVLGSVNGQNGATATVNVGIGTTSPTDRLHVAGNIRMVDGTEGIGKVLTSDLNGKATWQTPSSNWTLLGNAGTSAATNFIGTTDNVDFRIRTNNLARVSVTSGGRVGINNTAPATMLQVNGGITVQPGSTIALTGVGYTFTVGDVSFIRFTNTFAGAAIRFTDGSAVGQILIVNNAGTGGALAATVNDNAAVTNCNLNANRTLGQQDTLTMIWDGTDWIEMAFSDN